MPLQSVDDASLTPEEEAQLKALRFEVAQQREEALRDAAARDGLQLKVELLQHEHKRALEEHERLSKELFDLNMADASRAQQGAPRKAQCRSDGQVKEQALDEAKQLLASMFEGISPAAFEAAERAAAKSKCWAAAAGRPLVEEPS